MILPRAYAPVIGSLLTVMLGSAILVGCGSDSGGQGDANVVDLNLKQELIGVGEQTVLTVDFNFIRENVSKGQDVALVVHLPASVTYHPDSGLVLGLLSDSKVVPQVLDCKTSGSYLLFDLSTEQLDIAFDPPGGANGRLTLGINGVSKDKSLPIEARADSKSVLFSCLGGIAAEDEVNVTVG